MVILHVSDLHLNKKTEQDSISNVIEPLLNCIKEFVEHQKPIDLVVFSGDLVDRGGLSYDGDPNIAFLAFYDLVIDKVLKVLSIDESKFFIVPGNHDINRTLDSEIIESGLSSHFTNETKINDFVNTSIISKKQEGFERVKPYKDFEELLYSNISQKFLTNFASNFKVNVNGKSVGISCLNSSWRCYASDKDKGNLIIGEYQINQSQDYIKDCDLKIAISHHDLDYLLEFDRIIVESRIRSTYDVHLTGHVHRADSEYRVHSYGKLYKSVAAGSLSHEIRSESKTYQNGFSIIDFDIDNKEVTTYFLRYEYLKNAFVPNNSLGNDQGIFRTSMLSEKELEIVNEKKIVIDNISSDNLLKVNSHLITYQTDTKAPKTIDELFIMPTIETKLNLDPDEEPEIIENIQELIVSSKNYIVFGTKESGKTILLDKILIECLKVKEINFPIPVYLDFGYTSSDLITSIKNYMGVNASKAISLMENYGVTLLIDNILFEDSEKFKLKSLKELLNKYPKVRIIGTCQQLYKDEFPMESDYSNIFDYERLTIRSFKTKQIRTLIKKWFKDNDKYETPKKLQTILSVFQALSLPRTPFAVSLFLWIIEKQENFKPINNSTLIENFIEKLLDKHNKSQILSEKFDYKNQIRLLADIAHHMYEKDANNYRLSYSELIQFVDKYLAARQFNMKTQEIVNRLLMSGIFSYDHDERDYVRFRFTCFFEFFLVRKMEVTPTFKAEVLSEDNYLRFINEIDYFTGLHREETDILELVLERMNSKYKEVNEGLPDNPKLTDELFNTGESIVSKINEKKFIKYLPESKPTEEDLDIQEDQKLEMQNEEKDIKKKENEDGYRSLAKILVLTMRVLKNSEEVSKSGLKQEVFDKIIKNSISFAVIYKITLQQYMSQNKEMNDEELELTNKYLPLLHELFLYSNVGTSKLLNVIKNKIDTDIASKDVSEFEKYMIVFIYADMKGPKYLDYLKALIKKSKRSYILDMAFFKIITYYFIRSKDEVTDNAYLNLIGDIFVKTRGHSKSKVIQMYKEKKIENNRQMKLDFE